MRWSGDLAPFITLAVDGGDRSALRPGRYIPGKSNLVTHWIRGLVDPRTGLDTVEQ
jgi:hypothetical protein